MCIRDSPYDVQFILMGRNLNVLEVRNRIDAMGDSTVVVDVYKRQPPYQYLRHR